MRVEFFSGGCSLCQTSLSVIRNAFPDVEIEVHEAGECTDGSCCQRAARVGVKAVPSLVANEQVVLVGVPQEEDIQRLRGILGQ